MDRENIVEVLSFDEERRIMRKKREVLTGEDPPRVYRKNVDAGVEMVDPPIPCKRCKSTDRKVISSVLFKDAFMYVSGKLVKGYRRVCVQCKKCGQRQIIKKPILTKKENENDE